MKSAAHIFLIAILLFVVNSGCQPSRERRLLSHAEAVMEEHPDSAYKMLESIDTGALSSAGDKALYYLLMTQAMVKNDIPITSDSLIRIAVDYFSDHGRKTDKMKALFYLGQINYNNIDYPSAIVATMQARDIAKEMDSTYWQAKAAELQSFILSASYKHDEAITYSREAAELYKKSGHFINYLFSLTDLAIDYGNDGNPARCIAILDSIRSIPSLDTIYGILDYNLETSVSFNLRQENIKKASILMDSLIALRGKDSFNSHNYEDLARICLYNNDFNSCIYNLLYADSLVSSQVDKAGLLLIRASLHKQQGLYREALAVTDTILKIQSEEARRVLKESTIAAQRDYNNNVATKNKNLVNRLYIWLIAVGVLVVIIVITFLCWYKLIKKITKLEIDKKINYIYYLTEELQCKDFECKNFSDNLVQKESEIEKQKNIIERQSELILTLSGQIKEGNQSCERSSLELTRVVENQKNQISTLTMSLANESENNSELRATIENLFKKQWEILNVLCAEYIGMEDMPDKSKITIVMRIENHLKKLRSESNLKEIYLAVNMYMDGIIDKLQSQCSFLSGDDITFISLIYAGLRPKTVSLFTGCKLKYYYTKKRRLAERIEKSNPPDKNLFLSKLS